MVVSPGSASSAFEHILGKSTSRTNGPEPVSGVKGAGTADRPYDQGNQLEQPPTSNAEPISGKSGAGTVDHPYDQGNQAENQNGFSRKGASGLDDDDVAPDHPGISITRTESAASKPPQRGAPSETGASDRSARQLQRPDVHDRDMSPGELNDGTHVQCSGDRGESYQPSKISMGAIKGKFGIGRH